MPRPRRASSSDPPSRWSPRRTTRAARRSPARRSPGAPRTLSWRRCHRPASSPASRPASRPSPHRSDPSSGRIRSRSRLTSTATLAACAGSNVGEMFYLPVVDPTRQYNGYFKNKDTVTSQVYATIVHEFQPLINAGRHLYVNTNATRLEESWLDESQAMLAQELLYYRVSGFAPKQKLTWATISTGANANGAQLDLVKAYLVQGLELLNSYLLFPETSTPYCNTENLQTLGAGWQFMRYLLDNTTGTQATFSRAIDDGVVSGFANLSNVSSTSLPALASTYQSWAIAQYVDGTGVSSNPAYSNPSWNYRSVLPNALSLTSYPLRIRPLTPAVPVSVALRGGAASFIRFRVNAGLTAQITPANEIAASTLVTFALVRTF